VTAKEVQASTAVSCASNKAGGGGGSSQVNKPEKKKKGKGRVDSVIVPRVRAQRTCRVKLLGVTRKRKKRSRLLPGKRKRGGKDVVLTTALGGRRPGKQLSQQRKGRGRTFLPAEGKEKKDTVH